MRIDRSTLLFATILGVVVLIAESLITGPILLEILNESSPKGNIDAAEATIILLELLVPFLVNYVVLVVVYTVIGASYTLIRSRKTSVEAPEAMKGGLLTGLLVGFIGAIALRVIFAATNPEMYSASEVTKTLSDAAIGIAISTCLGGFFGRIGGASGASFVRRFQT